MPRDVTFAEQLVIINITATGTATLLRTLIEGALAGKTGIAAVLPPNKPILQIVMTPSADLAVSDRVYKDDLTLVAGSRSVFPVENALEQLLLKNIATVSVEIYYG